MWRLGILTIVKFQLLSSTRKTGTIGNDSPVPAICTVSVAKRTARLAMPSQTAVIPCANPGAYGLPGAKRPVPSGPWRLGNRLARGGRDILAFVLVVRKLRLIGVPVAMESEGQAAWLDW